MTAPLVTSVLGDALDDTLSLHDWPLSIGCPIRGQVLLLHGLGEHSGQYTELANRLNQWGFAVRSYDQYGHGESSGLHGELPHRDRMVNDLATVIDDTRVRMDDRLPLILVGHCLGALVAARLVSQKLRRVEGLVLASPPLDTNMGWLRDSFVRFFNLVAPNWRIENGFQPDLLTHDLAMVEQLRSDPLRHERVSARLAHFVMTSGRPISARAARWKVPTLLLYAGLDHVLDPTACRAFGESAPADVVKTVAFPMHYHALVQELQREPVYDALRQWLWTRYPAIALDWEGTPEGLVSSPAGGFQKEIASSPTANSAGSY